ncbi:MAG TPA: type II toxin-antitoxin system VapC family toxin [Alphaproteobacteria bacterium]|nr:type II toxin-antitoxin system VapC family toxin [Alphaproteobacteria bacterium]
MTMVIDSSVTLAWCFEDERTDAATALLRQVAENGAIVPDIWRYEIANGLHTAMIKGRIDKKYRDATFADLDKLSITIDPESNRETWGRTAQQAERFRLTIYDAAYLELAARLGAPLATFDHALIKAAKAAGVETAR